MLHSSIAKTGYCAIAAYAYLTRQGSNGCQTTGAKNRSQTLTPRATGLRYESLDMAYASDTRTASTTIGQRLTEMRAALQDRIARNRVFRTTLNELGALSNRELADLGIARSNIKAVAFEAAYGK